MAGSSLGNFLGGASSRFIDARAPQPSLSNASHMIGRQHGRRVVEQLNYVEEYIHTTWLDGITLANAHMQPRLENATAVAAERPHMVRNVTASHGKKSCDGLQIQRPHSVSNPVTTATSAETTALGANLPTPLSLVAACALRVWGKYGSDAALVVPFQQ